MARTLKYAILGLICKRPMSGYDILQEFSMNLSEFWSAKHSQIYPELKKLSEEELIDYSVEITGTVLEKKVYRITEKGKQEFLTWLNEDVSMQPTAKDVFRLRMYFSGQLEKEDRLRLLESQLKQHKDRLEHLKHNQEKFSKIPDSDSHEFGDYLVLMGAIMRENTNIEWLKECIRLSKR